MLKKFLNVHKLAPFSSRARPKPAAHPRKEPGEIREPSSVLKIVHAGGIVECYYMAMPAVNIMNKYPSFILARPQVFRRPWDSLVRSDEILTPGQKLYVVPRRTVRKLRRRIKKPSGEVSVNYSVSQSSIDASKDGFTSKSFLQRNEVISDSSKISSGKRNGRQKHVRFAGVDAEQRDEGIASNGSKKQGGKQKAKHGVSWHPSLTAISECHGPAE